MSLKGTFKRIKCQSHLHNLDSIIQGTDFVFNLEEGFFFVIDLFLFSS